jgi:hypothetical protein
MEVVSRPSRPIDLKENGPTREGIRNRQPEHRLEKGGKPSQHSPEYRAAALTSSSQPYFDY